MKEKKRQKNKSLKEWEKYNKDSTKNVMMNILIIAILLMICIVIWPINKFLYKTLIWLTLKLSVKKKCHNLWRMINQVKVVLPDQLHIKNSNWKFINIGINISLKKNYKIYYPIWWIMRIIVLIFLEIMLRSLEVFLVLRWNSSEINWMKLIS